MRLILTRGPPDFGADAAGLGALASFCPLPSANGPVRRIHQVHRDYALTAFIGREFVTDKYRSTATPVNRILQSTWSGPSPRRGAFTAAQNALIGRGLEPSACSCTLSGVAITATKRALARCNFCRVCRRP